MKLLHTSDWHLGKRLDRFSRLPEQEAVLDEICRIAHRENPDLILIPGDIFDTFNPSAEAVELLYRSLYRLSGHGQRPVIVLAGNHDSPERIESAHPLARLSGIFFIGYPHSCPARTELESKVVVQFPEPGMVVIEFPGKEEIRIIATPYAGEVRIRRQFDPERRHESLIELLRERWAELAERYFDEGGINILTAHLFAVKGEGPLFPEVEEDEGERPICHAGGIEAIPFSTFPPNCDYIALGHIHKPYTPQKGRQTISYSGSPLAYSFSESGQEKRIILAQLEPGKEAILESVPLKEGKALLRKRCTTPKEAIEWLKGVQDAYVELVIEVEHYLESEAKDAILEAHPAVLALIPELKESSAEKAERSEELNLDAPMEQLFAEYYRSRSGGLEPEPFLLELFTEVLSESEEEGSPSGSSDQEEPS